MAELPTPYQQYIHLSRYSRWRDDLGRRETWDETVDRLGLFWENEIKKYNLDPGPVETLGEIIDAIKDLEVMPSMRSLMTAGPALDRDHCSGYNCAFCTIDHPRAFDEIMYILLCGTGMGFSVQQKYIGKLPEVAEDFTAGGTTIKVKDSKVGWAEAFRELISLLYSGRVPEWDVSNIRPAGSRLKTFGGRASGPEPLEDLFHFSVDLFKGAAGRRLTSLECHDLVCKVADIVVVGGVRRSALISLSDLSDDRMRNAKSGQWWVDNPQRALANNSYVAEEQPDFQVFLHEWYSLYKSKCGERGIFSLPAARETAQRTGRRDETQIVGSNPCQPTWAKVLTPKGIRTLGEVSPGDFIWSKEGWTRITDKQSSGVKPVYKFATTAGVFYGTEEHGVVSNGIKTLAKDAECIDIITGPFNPRNIDPKDVMDGLVIGDGMVHKASNNKIFLCIGQNDGDYFTSEISGLINRHRPGVSDHCYDVQTTIESEELPKTYNRFVPERFKRDLDKAAGFLRGLFSANGTVAGNRASLRATSKTIIEDVQAMLSALGIRSYYTTNKPNVVKFSNGEYLCKESYSLNISTDRHKFVEMIGFIQHYKMDKLKIADASRIKTTYDIKDKSLVSEEEVFDITVDNPSHTYWTEGCDVSNCNEILLRDKQMCNLTEVVVREDDTLHDLKRKVSMATVLGTLQSTLTEFRYLRKKWKDNCVEERLLGVSLTGICDHPVMAASTDLEDTDPAYWLEELRAVAIETNREWADLLGITPSTAITCVKPSGTVSQLVDSASGIHPRFSKYYVRRVRNDKKDPLSQFLIDNEVPYEEDFMNKETYVFSFPVKAPERSFVAGDMGAMDQLNLWSIYAQHWCDHKPSMTVYYTDDTFLEVGSWIWNNFGKVSGVSFLPYADHTYQQAPYEAVSEEEYSKLSKAMPESLDWETLSHYETEDRTRGSQEIACAGNTCEI